NGHWRDIPTNSWSGGSVCPVRTMGISNLTDVGKDKDMNRGSVSAQWLGHSTFILTSPEGFRILIDPWLDGNPACPTHLKDPGPLDAILVTHGHFDHIDDCVPVAKRTGAPVVGIPELCAWLNGKGVDNTED